VEKGVNFVFNSHACIIKDAKHRLIAVAYKVGSLYHAEHIKENKWGLSTTDKPLKGKPEKEDFWHCRYGHLGFKSYKSW